MSVVAFELNAETRSEQGKGASRRLRIAGRVPAVLYGAGKAPELLSVSQRDILLQLENEAFYSHVLDLKIGDRAERVVLRDLQRHPYKPMVLHLDLQRVDATQQITVHVPLHFVNQEAAVGVKQQGGVVSHHLSEIEVTCLPDQIPEFIEVDLIALELGQALHVSQLVLPAGCTAYALTHGQHSDEIVVSIHAARAGGDEEAAPAA